MLSWALRRLAHELAHASPGGAIVIQHLGHIMLVEMLRLYLERGGDGAPSWLLAVSDPRIGAAIQAIHADPARVWTVEALAEVAGVSRPRWPCISSARRASRRWNTCCAGACNWRRAR